MGWRFHVERLGWARGLRVWGVEERPDGKFAVIKPLELVQKEDVGADEAPFIDMPVRNVQPMLQALVDACWEAGIKPMGYDDYKRINDAQALHLNDMRTIVATKLECPLLMKVE